MQESNDKNIYNLRTHPDEMYINRVINIPNIRNNLDLHLIYPYIATTDESLIHVLSSYNSKMHVCYMGKNHIYIVSCFCYYQ